MRFIKIILIFVLSCVLIISIWIQVGFENYMTRQNDNYKILNGKTRISREPVVSYFFKKIILKRDNLDRGVASIVYNVYAKSKNNSISSTGYMDEYMIHCYFTNDEKILLKANYFKGNYQ